MESGTTFLEYIRALTWSVAEERVAELQFNITYTNATDGRATRGNRDEVRSDEEELLKEIQDRSSTAIFLPQEPKEAKNYRIPWNMELSSKGFVPKEKFR